MVFASASNPKSDKFSIVLFIASFSEICLPFLNHKYQWGTFKIIAIKERDGSSAAANTTAIIQLRGVKIANAHAPPSEMPKDFALVNDVTA